MNIKHALLITFLSVLSTTALADTSKYDHTGWYIGGSLGGIIAQTELDISSSTKTDVNAASLNIYGGLNFNSVYGLEFSIDGNDDISDDNQGGDYDARISTIQITPKLTAQITDIFSLYARAGVTFIFYTEEYDNPYLTDDEITWAGLGGTIGVGAQFSVSKHLHLRISIDRTQGKLSNAGEDDNFYDASKGKMTNAPDVDIALTRAAMGLHYQF